jgi:inactive STAND/Effector-associated domain 9
MSNNGIIQTKESYLKILYKKYENAYEQKAKTLNDADKVSIQAQIDSLEEEIAEIEKEIRKLRSSSNKNDSLQYRTYHIEWKQSLPKIDFKSSKKIIKNIIDKFDNHEAEEVIFLLQDSQSMAGRLLIEDIKLSIEKDIGIYNDVYNFGFLEHQQTSQESFLAFLARMFNIELLESNIIDEICKQLRGDSIFFATIDIYCLEDQDDFLEWFVQFWGKLVERVAVQREEYPLIKLIAVISVRGLVPKTCLKEHLFCKEHNFDGKKILELPLQNWNEDDIWKWLEQHSGLRNTRNLQLSDMKRMAKNIFKNTKGEPIKIYHQLIETMSREVI